MTVFTVGVWEVKRGRADDFVKAWHALGQWTLEAGYETHGTLLRHHDDPTRFVSFGPWRSADDVARWRSDPRFVEHLQQISETLRSFEPGTYDLVLSVS